MSLISYVIITSLISCHSSHVSISCPSSHVTHLMFRHYVTVIKLLPIYSPVAKFHFCPRPLHSSHRIILSFTSGHPLSSNLCPPCSVLLPRRLGIGFQGVSHSSPSRSHVTHLMSLISCLIITSLISCPSSLFHSSHVSSLRHSAWPQGISKGLSKGFTNGLRKEKSQKV